MTDDWVREEARKWVAEYFDEPLDADFEVAESCLRSGYQRGREDVERDVLYIRCLKHRAEGQLNSEASGGAECGACIAEQDAQVCKDISAGARLVAETLDGRAARDADCRATAAEECAEAIERGETEPMGSEREKAKQEPELDDRVMRAFRLRLRRLAKQWREAGDTQAANDLDDLLDE